MVEVMAGYHPDHVLDRFLPALGMLPIVLPLIRRQRLEEREVRFTHDAAQFDGFAGIAIVVMSGRDPGILIVRLDERSRRYDDHAHAPSNCDFDVGEVSE